MKRIRAAAVLAALILVVAAYGVFADGYDPPDDYQEQLLEVGEPQDWPNWKHAMVRGGTLDWFRGNCEAGALPWPAFGGLEVEGHGILSRWAGNVKVIAPFPLSDWAYANPRWSAAIAVGLTKNMSMQFGVYCVYVSPTIEVRLTCERTADRTVGCREEAAVRTIDLSPGFTWLLVDDELGLASGFYTVKTRCFDGTDTCTAGGVTGMYLYPNTATSAYVPGDLLLLLDNPRVIPPPAYSLSVTVAPIHMGHPYYDRSEWEDYLDEDGDCQYPRQEVLIAEATGPVTFTDDDHCTVASGAWTGPFTWETFTNPSDLDIDHFVPLYNAHLSGGWQWTQERKELFGRDLSHDNHLNAVKASANRSKGASGPEDWRPPIRAVWCDYAKDWIDIKNRWELTVTSEEADALEDMLNGCTPVVSLTRLEPAD